MENYKANKIGEVKGLGVVYQAAAPLPEQITALQEEGADLVTPEDVCAIRISGLSNDYTRTCIAPIGVRGEKPLLYKPSPLINILMARIAVKSHADRKYPTFDRDFYEIAKEIANAQSSKLEPEDRTAQILNSNEDYDLAPEMDDAKFILGNHASEYFKKFKHPKIRLYNLPTNDLPKDKCAINYLWFDWPDVGSLLYCGARDLDYDSRAFGVRKSAEGAAKNSGFTLTNIKNAIITATPKTFEEAGLPRIKEIITKDLETNILETLRNNNF